MDLYHSLFGYVWTHNAEMENKTVILHQADRAFWFVLNVKFTSQHSTPNSQSSRRQNPSLNRQTGDASKPLFRHPVTNLPRQRLPLVTGWGSLTMLSASPSIFANPHLSHFWLLLGRQVAIKATRTHRSRRPKQTKPKQPQSSRRRPQIQHTKKTQRRRRPKRPNNTQSSRRQGNTKS